MSRNRVSAWTRVQFAGLLVVILAVAIGPLACQSGGEPGSETQMQTQVQTQTQTQAPAEAGSDVDAPQAGEQLVTYTCPMHPEVVSNEPGKCPTCGMNLVPVEAPTEPGADATKEM